MNLYTIKKLPQGTNVWKFNRKKPKTIYFVELTTYIIFKAVQKGTVEKRKIYSTLLKF